ncbi:S-type anion channel SLAH2 isoform X2 [Physcomitrium patens]|uniref:S-type anion channel SLAH2 isoform X2 n=1 Tax=Physcomitrium patens TaxID=3218 RepID=UPI000D172C0B|nr:S-type anion channel SLAH2-like isoform X2 [Physcomitrium patens]|eukprot:XP_024395453.1 S-type anion channel SLAH2-like isoform X2 [Physcomitrella patens]
MCFRDGLALENLGQRSESQMQVHQAPRDLESQMEWNDVLHTGCERCNMDTIFDMPVASQTGESLKYGTVDHQGIERHENQDHPPHKHRHSLDKSSLDAHQSNDDFHRRLSLDEVDTTHFPESYLDRMNGIELDRMNDARDSMFPLDKRWPFLLRVPVNVFGISMGIGSQSMVWKALATERSMQFLHVPSTVGTIFWVMGIVVLIVASVIYALKLFFWPKAVYREFVHPVRSNFFFGPLLSALFLLLGAPTLVNNDDRMSTLVGAFVICVPILLIEVHFYGHWLMGGHNRRLSVIANPTTEIAVIGNFVGATAFAKAGWHELGLFFFSFGLLHQIVVFLTIYMRLPSNTPLGSQLHPVLFLFVAPPSTAATTWIAINGSEDSFSKILTFIGLFLYLLLVSRANHLVRGVRFSLAWWAYTFPMAAAALAVMAYATATQGLFAKILAAALSFLSSATVTFVFVFTIARTWSGHLFPNDEVVGVCLTPDPTVRNEVSHFSNPCPATN